MDSKEAFRTYSKGNDLRAKNKDPEALEAYHKALEMDPNLWQAQKGIDEILQAHEKKHIQLSELHIVDGQIDKAIQELENILSLNSDSWKARKNLAQIYFDKKNDLVKAVIQLKKAISISPNLCGLHLTLAKIYDTQENFELALKEYDMALQINPSDHLILDQKTKTDEIVKLFDLVTNEKDPTVYIDISNFYLEKEMPNKAVQILKKAAKISGKNQEIVYALANACYRLKNFEEAIQFYVQAAGITPPVVKMDKLYYNLGLSYSTSNLYKDAVDSMQKCIQLNPYGRAASRAEDSIDILKLQIKDPES